MHLKFLDTSPLQGFASGLRSKLRASSASVTSAALSTTNEEDPTFTCAELARSLHC